MTLDELAQRITETYAPGCVVDDLDRAAARAVLLAVAGWLRDGEYIADDIASELRRIAGEVS